MNQFGINFNNYLKEHNMTIEQVAEKSLLKESEITGLWYDEFSCVNTIMLLLFAVKMQLDYTSLFALSGLIEQHYTASELYERLPLELQQRVTSCIVTSIIKRASIRRIPVVNLIKAFDKELLTHFASSQLTDTSKLAAFSSKQIAEITSPENELLHALYFKSTNLNDNVIYYIYAYISTYNIHKLISSKQKLKERTAQFKIDQAARNISCYKIRECADTIVSQDVELFARLLNLNPFQLLTQLIEIDEGKISFRQLSDLTEKKAIISEPTNSVEPSFNMISEESQGESNTIRINLSSEDIFEMYKKLTPKEKTEVNQLIVEKFFNSDWISEPDAQLVK